MNSCKSFEVYKRGIDGNINSKPKLKTNSLLISSEVFRKSANEMISALCITYMHLESVLRGNKVHICHCSVITMYRYILYI